jgi:PAS domain S-box-containing protein
MSPALIEEISALKQRIRELEQLESYCRKSEKELKKTEEMLNMILDFIPAMIWQKDLEGRYFKVNSAYCTTVGLPEEAILGKTDYDLFPQEIADKYVSHDMKVIASGKSEFQIEEYHRKPSGEYGWSITDKFACVDDNGNISGTIGFALDITELRRMALAIADNEEHHRVILKTAMDGFCVVDTRGRLLEVNEAYCRMSGYSEQELLAMSVSDLEAVESGDDTAAHIQKIMRQGEDRFETRHRRKDGTVFDAEVGIQYHAIDGGRFIAFIRDITARKLTEKSLEHSEQKYRSIFDNAVEGIFQTAPEGLFINVNPAMASIHGFASPEEMVTAVKDIGKQLYVNAEDRERYCAILKEKGEVKSYEVQVYRKDGSIIWTSTNARAVRDASGNISRFEGTTEEITSRKLAEEKLQESRNELKWLFKSMINAFVIFESVFDDAGKFVSYRFIYINKAYEDITGVKNDEVKGKTVHEVWPETEPEWIKRYGEIAVTGVPRIFDLYHEPTKKLYHCNVYRPWETNDRFCVIFEDITEKKLAEEKLQQSFEKLKKVLTGTIRALSSTVETRDPYTAGHQRRVSELACAIAREMGLPGDTIDTIRMAGTIHDIGKISVPAELLAKPTQLTDIEMSLIKVHAQSGYDILKDAGLPYPIAEIVFQHHERLDGSGYPQGLKTDEILLESRILSVADVVEATASHRPYRPGFGIDMAIEEIENNKGILYDEKVVEACVKLFCKKGFCFDPAES